MRTQPDRQEQMQEQVVHLQCKLTICSVFCLQIVSLPQTFPKTLTEVKQTTLMLHVLKYCSKCKYSDACSKPAIIALVIGALINARLYHRRLIKRSPFSPALFKLALFIGALSAAPSL